MAPEVDEDLMPELPRERARRLAAAKACEVSLRHADSVVIGSDQVCSCANEVLRKPGTAPAQADQLARLSGCSVQFDTAVCVAVGGQVLGIREVPTQVRFRSLRERELADYVRREPAADCAGGFKVEGLGISLFEWVRSDDPTALVGLPLIATAELLRQHAPSIFQEP